MNRYYNTPKIKNEDSLYKNLLNNKKVNFIQQYETKNLSRIKNIIYSGNYQYIVHIVAAFESLQDISYKYYGSEHYGWLISYTNEIGCELNIKIDDVIKIYFPISNILQELG